MTKIDHGKFPKKVIDSLLSNENYLHNCGLDLKLLELVKLRASYINDCAYCIDMHYKIAVHHGEDPQRLYSVSAWRETGYYTDKEKAALQFAESLTNLQGREIPEEEFIELKKHFSDDEISSLAIAIAQINTWNRLTRIFDHEVGSFQVK